jgi:hypothetical protein
VNPYDDSFDQLGLFDLRHALVAAQEFAGVHELPAGRGAVAATGQLYRVEPDLTCPPGGVSVLESVQLLDLALDSLLALPGNHTQG